MAAVQSIKHINKERKIRTNHVFLLKRNKLPVVFSFHIQLPPPSPIPPSCPFRKMGEMEDDEKVRNDASQILEQHEKLPRLVVFDLDYTLWPFYCDFSDVDDTPHLYPHVSGILNALHGKGIDVAIASRSPTPNIAKALLSKLGIQSSFVAQEIFSSWTHKTDHFQRIQKRTGVPFSSMLFFDDEDRNIQAVSKMGVTGILVGDGVNLGALRQGLSEFSHKSGSSSRSKEE